MPSNRRLRFLFALVVAVVIVTLYYSSEARETRNANFYRKTTAALEKSARDKRLQAEADAELQSILKHASELAGGDTVAEVAKVQEPNPISAAATQDAKIPPPPPGMEGEIEEQSIAGRKMMPKQKPKWDIGKDEEVAHNGGRLGQVLDPALAEAKDELNMILKKSPIIIFSKSYCPYSKKAKALLLDTYEIVPAPYVVELDLLTSVISPPDIEPPVTLGRKLQDLLAENTGRKTVPNILINGRSIGGSDDIAELEREDQLLSKIRDMGGRWVHDAKRRSGPGAVPKGRGI